jgi:Tfp pilus assembly protein PilF
MRYIQLLTACAVLLAVAGTALGQATKTGKTSKPTVSKPQVSSKVQVQGIVDRVVDGLWETTDYYWHDGDYNRIVSLVRVSVEADPSFNDAYSSAAWLLWSMGDTVAADSLLEYGVTRTQDKGDLYYELGWHLYNTKRYAAAQPYLEKAITYPNSEARWYSTLGHTYRQLKKYDEAVKTWETVVKKFPDFPPGKTNLERVKALQAGAL